MITTPITEIHEVELSSMCNLACIYCPHPNLERKKAHMSMHTFTRVLEHVRYYIDAGTQETLSLTGIGEAMLNPQFAEMVRRARHAMGDREILMSTNGIALTPELAKVLAENRITTYVSLHRNEVAAPAIEMLRKAGVRVGTNVAFVDSAFNWAGQVDWHVSARSHDCRYLEKGWAVIRQDGSINACCMDAHGKYKLAHIDDELGSLRTYQIGLCQKCHLTVPARLREAA